MLSNWCNFIRSNLPFSRKRSGDDANDEIPRKHGRLQSSDENSLLTLSDIVDMEKENQREVGAQWIAPRETVRETRAPAASTFSSTGFCGLPTNERPRARSRTQLRSDDVQILAVKRCDAHKQDEEVQHLATVRKIPKQRTLRNQEVEHVALIRQIPIHIGPQQAKPAIESIFQPFRAAAGSSALSFGRILPSPCGSYTKKALFDKLTYKQLLQNYHIPTPSCSLNKRRERTALTSVADPIPNFSSLWVNRDKEMVAFTPATRSAVQDCDIEVVDEYVKPRLKVHCTRPPNSLEQLLNMNRTKNIADIILEHSINTEGKKREVALEEAKLSALTEHNEATSTENLTRNLAEYMRITEPPVIEIEEKKEVLPSLPELTENQETRINKALNAGPPQEILASNFGLRITRRDMNSLKGLNWLNDEIINFYMNLIMERAKQKDKPNVYAFNTFFYDNMVKGQYARLRRWTRKVDLFSMDMVLAPVHLGLHWCMSLIDFRCKEVRYYDSMGASNNACLDGLLQYLKEESLDKKKEEFDCSGWKKLNVANLPQQMNGSDCGVFSCQFAEYLSRDAKFHFSQDDMPFLRRKMVIEILESNLIV